MNLNFRGIFTTVASATYTVKKIEGRLYEIFMISQRRRDDAVCPFFKADVKTSFIFDFKTF